MSQTHRKYFSIGSSVCKKNEVYSDCGTACEEICTYKPDICIDLCVQGCFCENGFVRDSNRNCVKRKDCRKCPKPNQDYDDCGTACPITCKNMHDPPMCKAMCQQGCICKKGFVLNDNGDCIDPKKCCRKR